MKLSGGNGRPSPHLFNRARAQVAPDPKGLAEQFVVQLRGICWAPAPCGQAHGASGGRAACGRGCTLHHTKRRAPDGRRVLITAQSRSSGPEVWKASWRKGHLDLSELTEIPKDPRALVTGADTPTKTLLLVSDGQICSKAGGE